MAIPYYVLGIIYLVGLVCAAGFFLFNLYHLKRFGFFDFTAFVITILTLSVMIIIIIFSIIFLLPVDWSSDAELLDTSIPQNFNF